MQSNAYVTIDYMTRNPTPINIQTWLTCTPLSLVSRDEIGRLVHVDPQRVEGKDGVELADKGLPPFLCGDNVNSIVSMMSIMT